MTKNYIESNVIEYKDIKEIHGFNCVVRGETPTCFYTKEFKYSYDNILWSDYRVLNNKNLKKIDVGGNTLYIQYRFSQVGNGLLSVENISLNITSSTETGNVIPKCYWNTVNTQTGNVPQIVYNPSNNNLFNPYAIGNSLMIYRQMSTLISNMFGLCVTYFKTEPNARTRDVVLKEYSIEHVIDKQNVKILIPDNQLPTKELQFNSMMIDYPVQFEIHIVKSEFQSVFGPDSHPDPHDYLYFQVYMNKMYMVDAVSEPDDFGYVAAYWRVSLVPYQEMSSVKFDSEDLQTDTETLIFSAEGKFEDEFNDEVMDSRKDNQLNDLGDINEGGDHIRRFLDRDMLIKKEKIYNNWTLVGDSYYDLSTGERDKRVVEYKYTTGFSSNDERMFTFYFKPSNPEKSVSDNITIRTLSEGEHGGIKLTVMKWSKLFEVGNYVKLSKMGSFNGYKKIIYVNPKLRIVEVEGTYTDRMKTYNCAKITGFETNNVFNIRNDEGVMFEFSQLPEMFYIRVGGNDYTYTFDEMSRFGNKWYAVVIGLKGGMSNLWLYELEGSDMKENMRSSLKYIGVTSNDFTFDFGDVCYYDIMSCNLKFTNFRMWKKLCEKDLHNVILSELVVDDTHNTLIVDNAKCELLLNDKWS